MASIVPIPTIRLIIGHTILIADRAFVLINLDTNIVSTIVYNPIKIIIKIVGNANFNRVNKLNLCASKLSCS